MASSIKQKIAQKEAELARLKDKERKLGNGQKIVIGGMELSLAKRNPDRAKRMLEDINNEITRETDLKRLEPIITELKEVIHKHQSKQQSPTQQQPPHNY